MDKKRVISVVSICLLLLLVVIFCAVSFGGGEKYTDSESLKSAVSGSGEKNSSEPAENDSIIGLWVYADGTKYEFNSDLTGGMYLDEYKYTYTYTYSLSGSELKIDYDNAEVRDSVYEYSFSGGKLRLVGGEGTAGGEYLLERTT